MEFFQNVRKVYVMYVVKKHKIVSSEAHNGDRKMKSTATYSQIFMGNIQ